MVCRVGYAPTTPAMSMQYSTIELTARINLFKNNIYFFEKILVSVFIAYINDKFIIKKVILKSLKKEPLGINGKNIDNKYTNAPI